MARFTIYFPNGVALYEGTPTFTGQYMKPGLLEFREVALPALVDLVPGCYVDYTRTGYRYRIYTVPQLKKQARSNSYGGAFVYQSVQLYDASKMLEYCPFRDLVTGDNRIHFSTQPSISTFEGCDGLARRFEACLQDQYGTNSWAVRIATQAENPALHDLMLEPREFTVSGMNILECLNKVYEIWPDVGWIYKVENGKDTIVIGGGGANPNVGTYAYGKGSGLKSITRIAANAEEIVNRIFAYGSSRNMVLPSWYRNQDIKDAESVDIKNIMLPILPILSKGWSGWGLTDGERDAAKAYVEDDASIAKNGLRPATVYFDGSGEYPEIYPTIRETTIGMVRTALGSSSAKYYPSTAVYTNPADRVDKLLSVQATFDSGKAGEDGKQSTFSEYITVSGSLSDTIPADTKILTTVIVGGSESPQPITFGASDAGIRNISMPVSLSGYIQIPGITGAVLSAHLHRGHPSNAPVASGQVELTPDSSNPDRYNFVPVSVSGSKVNIAADTYYIVVELTATFDETATATAYSYSYDGGISVSLSYYRAKTFNIALRQVGFDIGAQADLGNGKTIAMRTGDCVGRSFVIKSVQYDSTNDAWNLECFRSEDESLSQWFPNSQFGVAAGDEFVLLDIAMPDIYIKMASEKLLDSARELLADSAVERWQYTPEIDAKFMVENALVINAGESMTISDDDIIGETPDAIIVDTITINEGESSIPTYKVTLRDRKKKTWTESQSPEQSSSKSVGNITDTSDSQSSSSSESKYFTLDDRGNVTLKSQYQNLWVPGWMAAGGVGEGGSGGGGGASWLNDLEDVTLSEPRNGHILMCNTSLNPAQWVNVPKTDIASLSNGGSYSILTVNGTTGNFYTVTQVNNLIGAIDQFHYEIYASTSAITNPAGNVLYLIGPTGTGLDKYEEYVYANNTLTKIGDTSVDLSNYVQKVSGATNGHFAALDSNGNLTDSGHSHADYLTSIGTSGDYLTYTKNGANNNITVPFATVASKTRFTPSYTGATEIEPLLDWFVPETFTENNATKYRLRLNPKYVGMYADGWVSAGGVGTGGGGGGGATWLSDLQDVGISSPQPGHILMYDPTQEKPWVSKNLTTSQLGSGNAVTSISYAGGVITYTKGSTFLTSETDPVFSASAAAGITSTNITNWGAAYSTVTGSQTKNKVFASPSNGTGAPSFRALVAADIPSLTISKISDAETWISGKNYLTGNQTITLSGDVSGSGTTSISVSIGTGKVTNAMLAGNIENSKLNTIGVAKGGTGLTSITKGAILYASAANTIAALSANGTSTKRFLTQTSDGAPAWGVIAETDMPASYLKLSGGTMTGPIERQYASASNSPMLKIGSNNQDVQIFKVYSSDGTYSETGSLAGYSLKYIGTGTGVTNYLRLVADNQSGPQVTAIGVNQSGQVGILMDANTNYSLSVSGNSYFNGSVKIGANAYLVYDSNAKALRVYGTDGGSNIGFFCDGWVAAGGVGSGGGSTGSLEGCVDVEISSPHTSGDLLRYNGTKWVNVAQSSIVPNLSVSVPSSGNALTGVSYSNGVFTYTKGTFATSSDLSGYLPLAGGTLTNTLYLTAGKGIQDTSGAGLLVYHPAASSWTGLESTQFGIGPVDSQTVIRSSNTNLLHYKGGTSYTIYDASNFSVTLNGSATTSASFYAPTGAGTSGYVLKSNGSGAPTWVIAAPRANYADAVRDPDYYSYSNRRTSANINYTDGALHYYLATSAMTTGKPNGDAAILHCGWDNIAYNGQLSIPTGNGSLQHRYSNGSGTWSEWKTIAFTTDNVASADYATNAGTATKLGTATVGASNRPIYLNDGTPTVCNPGEAYLAWGGRDLPHSIGFSPVDCGICDDFRGNRTMFAKAAGIAVEYSTDGGTTWRDYDAADSNKVGLFSVGTAFYLGKGATANVNNQLRVRLLTSAANVYTVLRKFVIEICTYSHTCWCTIRARLQQNYENNTDTWTYLTGNETNQYRTFIDGYTGYNVINYSTGIVTYGNNKGTQYGEFQFIFGHTEISSNTQELSIRKIFCYGGVGWAVPSTMAKTGHLYSYDASQNATFPARIYATSAVLSGPVERQYNSASDSPVLKIGSYNQDIQIFKVYSSDGTYSDTGSIYGYSLKYIGTGSGVDNLLRLVADNGTGPQVTSMGFNQNGQVGILMDARTSYSLSVSGDTYLSGALKIGANAYLAYDANAKALRVYGTDNGANIGFYCDGWVAAGGVGTSSGNVVSLDDLSDVTLSTRHTGDLLYYDGSKWINKPQSEIVPTISVSPSGTGNGVTGLSYSNGVITYTKGTFLTASDLTTNNGIYGITDATTWNNNHAGVQVLNSISSAVTGAPRQYETALSVWGYYGFQLSTHSNQNTLSFRSSSYNSGSWSDWVEIYHTGNISSWTGSSAITTIGTLTSGSVPLSLVTGADDLQAIEALTGTSGLLKKTAANTWTLDTTAYTSNTGTVTSVTIKGGAGISVSSSSAITTNGTRTISIASDYQTDILHGANAYTTLTTARSANTVFAGPSSGSSSVAPTFRALVAADIPSLSVSKLSDLSSWTGSSSITTLGTISSGDWSGTLTVKTATTGTPTIVLQRGTTSDNYYDWKIRGDSGYLYFIKSASGTDTTEYGMDETSLFPVGTVTSSVSNLKIGKSDNFWAEGYIKKMYVSSTAYISSDSATNIYLQNSSGSILVCDGTVVRRGTSLTSATLGSSTYRWAGVYSKAGNFSTTMDVGSTLSVNGDAYLAYKSVNSTNAGFRLTTDTTNNLSYMQIRATDGNSGNLTVCGFNGNTGGTARFLFSTVAIGSSSVSGRLSLPKYDSTITIGPVIISYDSVNKALHISGTDSNQTIGLYCDGWVAAGGVQASS